MSSEEAAIKREKKKHKAKKQKADEEAAAPATPSEEPPATTEPQVAEDSGKKRKRDVVQDELEIDVTLPEPPSKKALRKAKKAKTAATAEPEANGAHTQGDTHGESTAAKPATTTKASSGAGGSKKDEDKERRTEHSIWIGNLPWTASKQDVRDFLCDAASLSASQITRLHMPAPDKKAGVVADTRGRPAFTNRGFAYVDFDSAEALFAALQLTETPFYRSGRNVLIKNAKSFEGRPDEHAAAAAAVAGKARGPAGDPQKPPSKRVFVGNLAFEITKDDLERHFGQCGEVEGIHMATFEDSGKCKGYAWVTFATLEAAEAAVRGWIIKEPEDEAEDEEEGGDEVDAGADGDAQGADTKAKRKKKGRKWFVNRLIGREIKREYAEDASVRYKKRYGGGDKRRQEGAAEAGDAPITEVDGAVSNARAQHTSSHDRRREQRKAQKPKVDARSIAPGAALARAQRSTAAIAESKGSKITFD